MSVVTPENSSVRPDQPKRMRREAGRQGLLFIAVSGIIGSGWLLSPMFAAQDAGPAALISWVLGGIAVAILALSMAELSTMFPLAGGIARHPHFAFGGFAGWLVGWLAWLGFVTTTPVEVLAALQYATNYIPWLTHQSGGQIVLTGPGYVVAAGLMVLFAAVNILGVRWLLRTTVITGWWKLIIPLVASVMIIAFGHHGHNLTSYGGFAPYGVKGILLAVAGGGIIFAYTGFEQAAVMAGETKNPSRNVPIAVIGSVGIVAVIYVLLQLALLLGVGPAALRHGWAGLTTSGFGAYGPFASIATTLGLSWVAVLLYIDAFVSPAGCGLVYVATTARTSYAMGRNLGLAGSSVSWVSKEGVPVFSIILAAGLGLLFLLPFPSWQVLVSFITSSLVMMYGLMPPACAALRRQLPKTERPYRVPGGDVFLFLGFLVANLIIFWTGWNTNWKLLIAIGIGLALLVPSLWRQHAQESLELRHGWWLLPYLVGLGVLSYLGTFGGGKGYIPFGWDFLVVIAFSVVIWLLALASRLPAERVEKIVQETGWDV